MPAFCAMLRPPAPRRLLITSEISPPNDPFRLAFSSDWKFEPRPDSNTATRFVTRVALAESYANRVVRNLTQRPARQAQRVELAQCLGGVFGCDH